MYFENPFKSFGRPVHEFHFPKVSRLDVAKQKSLYESEQPVPWTGNLKINIFFQNIDAGEGFGP